MAMIRLMYI